MPSCRRSCGHAPPAFGRSALPVCWLGPAAWGPAPMVRPAFATWPPVCPLVSFGSQIYAPLMCGSHASAFVGQELCLYTTTHLHSLERCLTGCGWLKGRPRTDRAQEKQQLDGDSESCERKRQRERTGADGRLDGWMNAAPSPPPPPHTQWHGSEMHSPTATTDVDCRQPGQGVQHLSWDWKLMENSMEGQCLGWDWFTTDAETATKHPNSQVVPHRHPFSLFQLKRWNRQTSGAGPSVTGKE